MGSALCTWFKQNPVKVLFYGLDASGKTTLLYKLKLGEVVTTIPTIGFNVEELDINGIGTVIWDVSLRDKGRPLIHHYLPQMDALVYLVDSTDWDRLNDVVEEFFQLLHPTVQERQLPVVVLANKQDKARVMSPEKIKTAFCDKGGVAFSANTALEVFPTVALTLEGVTPAMDWLTSQLAFKMARASYVTPWWSRVKNSPASFMKRVVGQEKKNVKAAESK